MADATGAYQYSGHMDASPSVGEKHNFRIRWGFTSMPSEIGSSTCEGGVHPCATSQCSSFQERRSCIG